MNPPTERASMLRRVNFPDALFYCSMGGLAATYIALILALLAAIALFHNPLRDPGYLPRLIVETLANPEIRYSIDLSMLSCTATAVLSLLVAVPTGYLLSRQRPRGKGAVPILVRSVIAFMDAILDIPIVLPPLVIGLALLILFQTPVGHFIERYVRVTYAVPSVVLAQFAVACAFAVRTMQVTFAQINPRQERVALTLGCSRAQAFFRVALPEARRGMLTAGTLAWAQALGEFGPILVFSGATRMRTEVLPTSVFLELSIGNIEAAIAVSLIMIVTALTVLTIARMFGLRSPGEGVTL